MKIWETSKGSTQVYGIIGNPVKHSFSPVLQTTLAKEMGVDGIYVPFEVANKDLSDALNGAYGLGVSGMNVTVPYKKEVMPFLCDVDKEAMTVGAVNTLKRTDNGYKGYNTDIIGLEKTLDINNIDISGKNVVILGAGGAANSATVLAAKKEAKSIYIVNRTKEKALALKELIAKEFSGQVFVLGYNQLEEIEDIYLVFQTTSIGMGKGSETSPVADISFFEKVQYCIDVIYTPWETKFLKDAKEKKCVAINGFDMLVYQGIASFEIWHDTKIEKEKALEFRELFARYYKGEVEIE